MEYVDGLPVFELPGKDKASKVTLETIITECFQKIFDLSVLTYHKKPCITVISGMRSIFLSIITISFPGLEQ